MRRTFIVCGLLYIAIYAFEGAVRYFLHLAGADDAIFVRDALLILPCLGLFAVQASRLRVHPAFLAFGAIIAVHGALMMANLRSYEAVAYGIKLLMGELFGFIAGGLLVAPGRRTRRFLELVLFVSVVGILLDKWVLSFPWEGMSTHIGGLKVAISTDWETGNGIAKRVAGFTRVSIAAAILIPVLTLLVVPRLRSGLLRMLMLAVALGVVFLTTQKGAVLALLPVAAVFLMPRRWRFPLLGVLCTVFALLDVLLPIVTDGMVIGDSGGVFSMASFAMRVIITWPDAWHWILLHQIFPLGVGLGGIGGAMRLYAPNFMNPADNMFLFLYAWFGIFGIAYLAWVLVTFWRTPGEAREAMLPAAAILTFLIGYGTVLSLLEDPFAALFVGAATGAMWQARQRVRGRVWADSFAPVVPDVYAEPGIPAAAPSRRAA
ncbi:MAG: hypothetical protein ACREFY_17675 [Acetobacteraceae bacterium]